MHAYECTRWIKEQRWMQCVQAHRTDLEEGGGDGQVRVVPEAHGEDGVYRLISLRAGRTCTLQYVLAID